MTGSTKTTLWPPKVNETALVDVRRLALDAESPRLVRSDRSKRDEHIIADLYTAEGLQELLLSISSSGYMNIEPLVVVLDEEGEKLIVLEGNRRLAAILLLLNDELVAKAERVAVIGIDMPKIDDKIEKSLQNISVLRVKSRDDARAYIGLRHISGSFRWNSYAMARFMAAWHEEERISLEEISRRVGVGSDFVGRMVTSIYVLDQAKRAGIYDISDRWHGAFDFHHLHMALSRYEYKKYLGMGTPKTEIKPMSDLVPVDRLERLRNVLVWIFGSKQSDQEPVVCYQNPDIKNLGEVLNNKEARRVLFASRDLNKAHDRTVSSEAAFSTALIHARMNLGLAATSLAGYDGRNASLLYVAQDVSQAAKAICTQLKRAREDATADEQI